MSKLLNRRLRILIPLLLLASLAACDKISIPRLSFDEKPEKKVPVSVIYRFDPTLSQHTQEVNACGLPYTIKTGEIVAQTFLEVGQERFASVTTLPSETTEAPVNTSGTLTIDLKFIQASLEPVGRSGDEDRFRANVELQLQAVYEDSQGNPLAQTPLSYAETISMWTPTLSGQSQSCVTGQFDSAMENAAEALAMDMISVIPRLYGQAAPTPAGNNEFATPLSTQSIPVQKPSLTFRTRLQDANDNLILEGGEGLILQVETTNTSSIILPSAYVELRGSQTIVDAFSFVTTLPIAIGPLQPGETKTTEVHGRMPETVDTEKGELIISISLSQGIPPGAHKVLAAIQPHMLPSPQSPLTAPKPQPLPQEGKQPASTDTPFFALVIALDEYRDPWSEAYQFPDAQIRTLLSTLYSTNTFTRDHVRLLRGKHATRLDIEEALFTLAKNHLTPEATLFVYFGGHGLIDPESGEVYLTPYEGSVSGSKKRLISLRSLHRVLQKLNVKLTCLFLNIPKIQYLGQPDLTVGIDSSPSPNWSGDLLSANGESDNPHLVQVRRLVEIDTPNSELLLAGLSGSADEDHDGAVTLRELLDHIKGIAEILPPDTYQLQDFDILLTQ
ncbi:MAG: hypothetical protein MRJ96_02445 [Nitrospirales bacterium]|nr:hypothetical protein [Nitrospira sp.]MDR4500301.1 hypothetical protein [Nitrospirales bacterium]